MKTALHKQSPQTCWWVLAFLISPGLAFICLRVGRAIGMAECVLGAFAGLIVHAGLASVLAKMNDEPLQMFIVSLMGVSLFAVLMWQYLAGARTGYWSEQGKKNWKLAGRFFGVLLGLSLLSNIILFHHSSLIR